jgi:HD-GYP domain-containing protein (c-di-GMP phosphodiesterase class II)
MEKSLNGTKSSHSYIHEDTIKLLLAAASEHDRGAQGHGERVTGYAISIGQKLGLSELEMRDLKYAASLHDIGKIAISSGIINKLGRLTDEELNVMRRHSMIAIRILERSEGLRGALPMIRHHHERFDGNGYPDGLRADSIPLGARIIAVAETYDILMSDVPWRDALSHEEARIEIERCRGTQFDPSVVDALLSLLDEGFHTIPVPQMPQSKAA